MNVLKKLWVVSLLLVAAPMAWAASPYGSALVEQGEMTILREGRSLNFKTSAQEVQVLENDLVRVREASRVTLKTQENATLTLGANAVFQVQPWQTPQKSGTFRMLFGRLRATVVGLAATERFNVKTATATIGVKGTSYDLATTTTGNTLVVGRESTTDVSGRDGVEQPVSPGNLSGVFGPNPATSPQPVPDEVKTALQSLNSAPPGTPGARDLPGEQGLIRAGIVSKETLDKSKSNTFTPGPQQPQSPSNTAPGPNLYLDDARQQSQSIQGHLNLKFEK
jgi:FecR-like protein